MPTHEVEVDAWTEMHSIKNCGCDQRTEVFVSFAILHKKCQVPAAVGLGVRSLEGWETFWPCPDAGSKDGTHSSARGLLIEIHGTIQITGIGDGHRGHFQRGRSFHQLLGPHGPIEEAVLGLVMEMHKRHDSSHNRWRDSFECLRGRV